jgi:hypothetical protein
MGDASSMIKKKLLETLGEKQRKSKKKCTPKESYYVRVVGTDKLPFLLIFRNKKHFLSSVGKKKSARTVTLIEITSYRVKRIK